MVCKWPGLQSNKAEVMVNQIDNETITYLMLDC